MQTIFSWQMLYQSAIFINNSNCLLYNQLDEKNKCKKDKIAPILDK